MSDCDRYNNLMWLSYARGLLAPADMSGMESHVKSCDQCRQQLDFARKVAAAVDPDPNGPPDDWVSEAAAKFDLSIANQTPLPIFGELVFDSYLHDKEGIRSPGRQSRHLLFQLPPFQMDLALEYSGRQLKMIMGHLLSRTATAIAIAQRFRLDLRIATRSYTAKPNQLGEFSFTIDAEITGEPLELRCTFEEGPCVIILIPC